MIVMATQGDVLCLIVNSPDGLKSTCRIPVAAQVFGKDANKLVLPLIYHYNKLTHGSQCNLGPLLNLLANTSRELCFGRLPDTPEEWQTYVVSLFSKWFEQTTRSLRTRISTWKTIAFWFTLLRDSKRLIPPGVEIPLDVNNKVRLDDEPAPRLLGEVPLKPVRDRQQKVLMDVSLVRSDAEYLDEIRSILSHRRAVLESAAAEWLKMINVHFRYGQQLIASVDYETEVKPHLNDPGFWRDWENRGSHKASGKTERSLTILLSLLRNEIKKNPRIKKSLFESEKFDFLPSYPTVAFPESAPSTVSPLVRKTTRVRWMLGIMSPVDYSYAHLFLTIHHPIFFGSAFYDARIISRQGDSLISLGGSNATVSLLKNRAHATKHVEPDEPSRKYLSMILEMTTEMREFLREDNPIGANRLLLLKSSQYFLSSPILRRPEGSKDPLWIGDHFPSVAKSFEGTTMTMRKVRATEGVLEWLKTGSILAATRRLGNSKQIFMEHYIPPELLASFYARQVRRYHNLFLAAAAPSDVQLSEILEFRSIDEIHEFIESNLKIEPFSSSPLGKILRDKTSPYDNSAEKQSDNELILPVSENSLATLYLYHECALDTGFNNRSISKEFARRIRGVTPDDVISLAELAKFRLPNDRDSRMREAHINGLEKCQKLKQIYKWKNLMLRVMKH